MSERGGGQREEKVKREEGKEVGERGRERLIEVFGSVA